MQDLCINLVSKYPIIDKIFEGMRENVWDEVKIQIAVKEDKITIAHLSEDTIYLLKKIITVFNGIDSIISKYLSKEFIVYFQHPSFQAAFGYWNFIEIIHQITYNVFSNTYFSGQELEDIKNDTSPNLFIAWVKKYIPGNKYINLSKKKKEALLYLVKEGKLSQTKEDLMAKEILASCLIEGVFIPTFFAKIFWFKERGYLDGFTKGNEYIEIDEDWHLVLGVATYLILNNIISQEYFYEMIYSFYDVIKEYCSYLKERSYPGLSYSGLMKFTEHRFDLVLEKLNYQKLFNSNHDLEYMRLREIKLRSTLFFTSFSTEYNRKTFTEDDLELTFDF